jgi:hypothetical protein
MKTLVPSNSPALFFWLTEAVTIFANGCLAGIGGGASAGVGVGTGAVAVTNAGGLTPSALSSALFAAGCAAVGNGVKRFMVWHDANPMPNAFVAPSSQSKPTIPQ